MNIPYVTAEQRAVLPIVNLAAAEVLQKLGCHGQFDLLLAMKEHQFYGLEVRGRPTEHIFPSWQFVSPVPHLITKILPLLDGRTGYDLHAFWVVGFDVLNELSPAEVLAGKPFETRELVLEEQARYLKQRDEKRVERIISLIEIGSEWS